MEDLVSQIIERLSEDIVLRNCFGLKGSVKFENHSNTLSLDRVTEGIRALSIANHPRRSECLRAHTARPRQTASTVYYSISVLKRDVGPSTDWNDDGNRPNRLHLTAVAHAVAFTLRAIQTRPHGAQ